MSTGQSPSSAATEVVPEKYIVHRARTLAKAVKEVQGMFFYQNKVLTQDALGLTSDSMYRYQHLIEEWHCH